MIGQLEQLLLDGELTLEEYREKKAVYVETMLELYIKDFITKEEFEEKINK